MVLYIDVQKARRNGLKFFSAPNDVNMCASDTTSHIPTKYFKKMKNIQTGEQIEIKSPDIVDKSNIDTGLSPLAKDYVPMQLTGMTPVTIHTPKWHLSQHTVESITMQNMRGKTSRQNKKSTLNY